MGSYTDSFVNWPSESHPSIRTPGSHPYSNAQGSPQPIEESTAPGYLMRPFPDGINPAVQEYKLYSRTCGLVPHPIPHMLAANRPDGTVMVVFGPPLCNIDTGLGEQSSPHLLQEDSRVVVPQIGYKCGNTQKDWEPKPTIYFYTTSNHPGVKLSDVIRGNFKEMKDRDEFPFGAECRGITIRMHFPGYKSSTDVERELKQRAEGSAGTKARSMQLSTKNYRVPPEPITKSKLAQEVSKRIRWHITDLETNGALFPFNNQCDQRWRLGQGRMDFERMVITELVNVSSGSWSPTICVE